MRAATKRRFPPRPLPARLLPSTKKIECKTTKKSPPKGNLLRRKFPRKISATLLSLRSHIHPVFRLGPHQRTPARVQRAHLHTSPRKQERYKHLLLSQVCRVVHQQSQNLLLHFISHKNYSLTIPAEVLKQGIPYTSTDCLRNILEIYLREKKSKSLLTFDWDFKFLTTLKPSQIFSTPSTLPLLPRDTVTSFSQLVRDITPAVIKKTGCPPGAPPPPPQVGRSKQPERSHQNF